MPLKNSPIFVLHSLALSDVNGIKIRPFITPTFRDQPPLYKLFALDDGEIIFDKTSPFEKAS